MMSNHQEGFSLKGILVDNIAAILILIVTITIAWSGFGAEINAIKKTGMTDKALLIEKINRQTYDRITKSKVVSMFDLRDIQITSLVEDVSEIKDSQKEQLKLIQEILREMPRKIN